MVLYMFSDFIISVFLLISYIFLIVLYLCFKQVEKNYLKIDLKTYINYYILMNYQHIMLIICLFFVYVIIIRLGLLGEAVISSCMDVDAGLLIQMYNEIQYNKNILRDLNILTTAEKLAAFEKLSNKLFENLENMDSTYFVCDKSEYEDFAKNPMVLINLKIERDALYLSCFQYFVLNKLSDNLSISNLTDSDLLFFIKLRQNVLNINYNNLCNYICAYNDFVQKLEVFNSNVPKVLDEYIGDWFILPKIDVLNEELNKVLIKNNLEPLVFSNRNDITNRYVFNMFDKFSDILKLNILNSDDIRVLHKSLLNFEMDCHNMYINLIANSEKCLNIKLFSQFLSILETEAHLVVKMYDNVLNTFSTSSVPIISIVEEKVEEGVVNNTFSVPDNDSNMPNNSNVSKNVANDASLLSRIINNHILGPYSITWSCAIWTVVGLVILNSYL